MRVLIRFAVVVFIIFIAGIEYEVSSWKYKEGQRWILFPDGEGQVHLVDLQQEEPDTRFDPQTGVKFYLHTRSSGEQEIIYNNKEALAATAYDPNKPVKFIVHGWNSVVSSAGLNSLLTHAFLESADSNVIVVDWSKGASTPYTTAVGNVPKAGAFVAKFIDWLCETGTPISAFHLVGHSLGGHLVGIAGRHVTAGEIPYITSLDPANPLWRTSNSRIGPSDADYVEVIHTDAGRFGLEFSVGDADFYPNKGHDQPGCGINIGCSHARAYEYFGDSIDHDRFAASECSDTEKALKAKCSGPKLIHMGGSSAKNTTGIFYLTTNKKKPYYRG